MFVFLGGVLPQNSIPVSRNVIVDRIRGISILLVLTLHFQTAYSLTEGFFADFIPKWILEPLAGNGSYGVTMFFVVSGYLITLRTLRRYRILADINFREFYTFRIARIIPCVVLMVFVYFVFHQMNLPYFVSNAVSPSWPIILGSIFTFTHNVLVEKYGYFNYCLNVLWSLSIEEVFYFAFPIVCVTLKSTRQVLLLATIVIGYGPLFRFQHRYDGTDVYGLYAYSSCFDAIAIGCCAAILKHKLIVPTWSNRLVLPLGLALAAMILRFHYWYDLTIGFSAIALCTGLILFFMRAERKDAGARKSILLQPIGKLSYEIYLFHIIILALLRGKLTETELGYYGKPLLFFCFLAGSFLISYLISRFYSEPLNVGLRRFLISKSKTELAG